MNETNIYSSIVWVDHFYHPPVPAAKAPPGVILAPSSYYRQGSITGPATPSRDFLGALGVEPMIAGISKKRRVETRRFLCAPLFFSRIWITPSAIVLSTLPRATPCSPVTPSLCRLRARWFDKPGRRQGKSCLRGTCLVGATPSPKRSRRVPRTSTVFHAVFFFFF